MQHSISFSITEIRSQDSTLTDFIKKWTTDEIEFFDSDVDEDDSIINVDRHVFYKNIYVFVDRLKNMIKIRDDDKLRTILSQCFRDASLIWHFIELFDMKKNLLRQINLTSWYQILINRFKKRISIALSTLQINRYTSIDAKAEKDSRIFAQNIFRFVKVANMNSIYNQLTIAWNDLDWQFWVNIFESTVITSIRKFLNQLSFMFDIWHEMTRFQNLEQKLRDRFQNPRRTQNYSEYLVRSNSLSFSYQYQDVYSSYQFFYRQLNARQYDRLEYQNRDNRNSFSDSRYFKKKFSKFASVLSLARQSLQITSENANSNASDFLYSEIKSKNQYKNNKYQKNYKEKERAYVIE
jgi:hypothetical protein